MSIPTQQATRYINSSSTRPSSNMTHWITFQHEQACVFVKPAETHGEAIAIAQKEFYQLANITQDRIAFTVEEKPQDKHNDRRRHVRISESAWPAVITKLNQGAIVNVVVRPGPDEKPPRYLEVPSTPSKKPSKHNHLGTPMTRTSSKSSAHSSKSSSGLFSWIGGGK